MNENFILSISDPWPEPLSNPPRFLYPLYSELNGGECSVSSAIAVQQRIVPISRFFSFGADRVPWRDSSIQTDLHKTRIPRDTLVFGQSGNDLLLISEAEESHTVWLWSRDIERAEALCDSQYFWNRIGINSEDMELLYDDLETPEIFVAMHDHENLKFWLAEHSKAIDLASLFEHACVYKNRVAANYVIANSSNAFAKEYLSPTLQRFEFGESMLQVLRTFPDREWLKNCTTPYLPEYLAAYERHNGKL